MVRDITLCTEVSICQCLCTWTDHPSQNELHILFFNSAILDYLYVPELSTLHNLNFLFCNGEILSTVKKPEPSWVWMVEPLVHTNLTFMRHHMHVLFFLLCFLHRTRYIPTWTLIHLIIELHMDFYMWKQADFILFIAWTDAHTLPELHMAVSRQM